MKFKHPFKSPTAWHGIEHRLGEFLDDVYPITTIVEVGVDKGYSICHFALRYPQAKVIGVDNWSYGDGPDAKEMLDRVLPVEFTNIELWHMESKEGSIKYKVSEPVMIDVLHIDADHKYESVKADFKFWEPLVRSGGVILFHDIQSFPNDVGRFFNELVGTKHSIQKCCGFGGWYK